MKDAVSAVASDLGLRVQPAQVVYRGPLRLGEHRHQDAFVIEGAIEGAPLRCTITADRLSIDWEPALDLGLRIASRHDGDVKGDDLEAAFELRADERERLVALITPELADRLAALRLEARVFLDDRSLSLTFENERWGGEDVTPNESLLARWLHEAARTERIIGRALARVPAARALVPLARAWEELAIERGLELDRAPLHLRGFLSTGELDGRVRDGHVELSLAPFVPGPTACLVEPHPSELSRLVTTRLGRRGGRFEQTFRVLPMREGMPSLLTVPPALREAALEASRFGEVSVSDREARLRAPLDDETPLRAAAMVDALARIAKELGGEARAVEGYRIAADRGGTRPG